MPAAAGRGEAVPQLVTPPVRIPVAALPFRGVVSVRPYPATGLTTARWRAEVPVLDVPLADLWLTQEHVVIPALWGHTTHAGDDYPHVVQWCGDRYLEDGHNRIVRAALTAAVESIPMRVFQVD